MANDASQTKNRKSPKRPTIGVLIARLGRVWGREFMSGLNNAAVTQDVNLLCFVGGRPRQDQAGESLIYQLASPAILDGLILYSDLGHGLSQAEIADFCGQFTDLPLISALEAPGLPILLPDSYGGMRQLLIHLVKSHGYQRIAFIQGQEGQADAEQRFQAYQDVLEEYKISFDPELVAEGDFSRESGRAAIQTLFVERKVKPQAVACANDRMAFGALQALQALGLQVPADVALTGFDDVDEARITGVPLTTVRQSFYAIGQQALENLLCLLRGETMAERVMVPTELVVRWSCGCLPEAVRQVTARSTTGSGTGALRDLRSRRRQ
jgi:DNA-binding LacI/PurR family transcriptional regulator